MRKEALATGVVVFLAGLLLFVRPFATREREVISSTPAAPTLFSPPVPIELKPRDQLCIKNMPIDSDAQLARLVIYTYGKRGTPLEVSADGPGYRFRGTHPGGYPEGPVELSLAPPRSSLDGEFCVTNRGDRKIGIQATPQGQRFSRPQPYLNGGPLEQDVPLTLHERRAASFMGQTGRAISHAAVLVPLGPALLWVLLLLVLIGVPAAVFTAVARAAVEPAGELNGAAGAPPPIPLARLGPPLRRVRGAVVSQARRVPPAGWLVSIVVAVLAFAYLWASRMGTFQLDESQYVYLARWMSDHLPGSLWNFSLLQRGLQRAEIYVLALTLGSMRSPDAFLVAHFINVAAYVSAAIPAYLLARGLGARAGWGLLAAALTVTGPWLVFAVSLLTEPLAYPAIVWLLWATWRAVADPRPRTQLVAIAVLFVTLLTRSAFLILIPLLPLVVAAQELRYGRRGAAEWARRIWKRYAVVVAVVALGVVVLLLSLVGVLPALSNLAGGYGTPFSVIWGPFLDKTALYASRVVVGVGFLPFAIGLPWLVRELFSADDERTHAFVVTAVAMIVLIVYASSPAGPDERYVIYFAPPLIAATVVALSRRRLGWGWAAAGGLLGAVLLYKHGWNPNGGAYGFFVGPAESFYARVGLLHLAPYVPSGLTLQKAAFVVALAATAVGAYAVSRGRHASAVLTWLLASLVLLQAAQGVYTTSKFVTQGGERFGPSHAQRAWVDKAVYGKATAAIIGLGQGNTGLYDPIWREIQFWNTSVDSEFALSPLQIQLPPGDVPGSIGFDQQTGHASSTPALPPYAVIPRGYVDAGLAGQPVAHATYVPADLVKLARPLQVRFRVTGADIDGYVAPRKPVTIRFYAAGLDASARWCGIVPVNAPLGPSGKKETVRYTVGDTRGSVAAGSLVNAQTELDFGRRPFVDATVSASRRVELPDKRVIAVQLGQISVKRC